MSIEKIKEIVLSWVGGSYSEENIKKLKKLNIPLEYKQYLEILYRGERFDKLTLSDLFKKKCRSYGLSWTTDLKTAEDFAKQNDSGYGVVWQYKPKPDDILLNVSLFARKNNIQLPYDEQEILLTKNITLTTNNIEKIIYTGETVELELPMELMKLVKASLKDKVKNSYVIYEAGKRDLYHPFDSPAIDEMIEEEEGEEGNAAWFVNPMNFERENEFNPPEKWSPSDEMQRYPFMSKKEYDSQGYPDGAWWVKTLAFLKEVNSKYQIKADFQDWKNGSWVHYSTHEDIKFKYKPFHNDPIGIYFFPENFRTQGQWHTYRYKFTAKISPSAKVLDLAKFKTKEEVFDLLKKLKAIPEDKEKQLGMGDYEDWLRFNRAEPHNGKWIDWGWEWLQRFFMQRQAAFTKAFLDLGYDALFDDTYSIHNSEIQLIVFNPKALMDIQRSDQNTTGFKEVTDAKDTILKVLSKYEGKILGVDKPKKRKGRGEPDYIFSFISFGHEERSFPDSDWKDYGRKINFSIRTISHSVGKGKKRFATEIDVSASGRSDAFLKMKQELNPDGMYEREHREHKEWRLEDFNTTELEAFVHKAMKMLWDDNEPLKYKEQILKYREQT